jgi:SAM-dependent methyltransferase
VTYDVPAWSTLERLVTSEALADRAFAAGELRRRYAKDNRAEVERLYAQVHETARAKHAGVRETIRERTFDAAAFLADIASAPLELRDHYVEEILGVAYPPLGAEAARETSCDTLDAPSGVAEILFAVEHAGLDPGRTFVDLGAGAGKVVLLVALLTGARATGVELDPALAAFAREAADSLGLDNASFAVSDIRTAPLPSADVYYMYIPFIGSSAVAARVFDAAPKRSFRLFSQALDASRLPWLGASKASSYWLEMYDVR